MALATSFPPRTAGVSRTTKETNIAITLCIDGGSLETFIPKENSEEGQSKAIRSNPHAFQQSASQYIDIDTGIGFLDHMLHALSKHAGWSLYVRCAGDTYSTLNSRLSL